MFGAVDFDLAEFAATFGWVAEPAERLAWAAAAIGERRRVAIVQEIGFPGAWLGQRPLPDSIAIATSAAGLRGSAEAVVWITDRLVAAPPIDEERIVWLRPKSLALGVGCERGVSLAALEDGLRRTLLARGFAWSGIATLASADRKSDEAAIVALAERHGWPTTFFAPQELARAAGIASPSALVEASLGAPGVAEPAALLAAESDQLLFGKRIVASELSPRKMTFALARLRRSEPARDLH